MENLLEIFRSEESLQRFLRCVSEDFDFQEFYDSLSSEERDWISNVGSDIQWFSNIPSIFNGTSMNNKDFITCILLRLRSMNFFKDAFCVRGEGPNRKVILLDSRHCTGCSTGGGIHFRHDLVKRVIFDEAQEASLQPRLEVANLVPGSQSRPADVFIPNWHNGIAAALDVCIVAPARSTPNSPAKDFGSHIDTRYKAKLNEHADDCKSVDLKFFPVVFSTGGAIHPKSLLNRKNCRIESRQTWNSP